jgi:hypothetical protein
MNIKLTLIASIMALGFSTSSFAGTTPGLGSDTANINISVAAAHQVQILPDATDLTEQYDPTAALPLELQTKICLYTNDPAGQVMLYIADKDKNEPTKLYNTGDSSKTLDIALDYTVNGKTHISDTLFSGLPVDAGKSTCTGSSFDQGMITVSVPAAQPAITSGAYTNGLTLTVSQK